MIFEDELFIVKHLSEADHIEFTCQKGHGLEQYLNCYALDDENIGAARTYLVIEKKSQKIAAYFSLRTGLITISRGLFQGFDAHTGIELANFAVNDDYKALDEAIPRFGALVFSKYILPIVYKISTLVGVEFLYIYALPNDRLMEHYKTMGFSRFPNKASRFVYRHVKPAYDKECIFMLQKI